MKRINILVVFLLMICVVQAQNSQSENDAMTTFGSKIDSNGALDTFEMTEKYQNLSVSDTLSTKFTATVTEVCKAKGCWMKLELDNGIEAMVKFKDYGFFMPKDIEGQQVVVSGKAFVEEMSVENQKHYAKDGDKSDEEIEQINAAKKTYSFIADGVLIEP